MPCCAQLFSNIENLQNIEFGIFVRSPRFSIIQNKNTKRQVGIPPSLPCGSVVLLVGLLHAYN